MPFYQVVLGQPIEGGGIPLLDASFSRVFMHLDGTLDLIDMLNPLRGYARLTNLLFYYYLTCHQSWLGAIIILFVFLGEKVDLNYFFFLEKLLSK